MSRGYFCDPSSSAPLDSYSPCSSSRSRAGSTSTSSAMSSPQSPPADRVAQPYLLVPNLHVSDPAVREIELGNHPWMVATVIEDDDLTFGGKPLSAWYEEDRRRLSGGDDEEEQRGRQRERARIESHHHHHQHHAQNQQHHHYKQQQPHQQHQYAKKPKDDRQ